jgi:drug/metabolite transporter (DMT)-like permease
VPILLAIGSSLSWGVADFSGGMAARRVPAITVVVASHLLGLGLVVAIAVAEGSAVPAAAEFGWGAASGVVGGIGLALLYHAIVTTRVAVAAPAATLFGALVPILFGVVIGERPSAVAWAGIGLALPAVAAIASGGGSDRTGSSWRSLALGLGAGAGFGLFGILISRTGDAAGMWPLVGARGASIVVLSAIALVQGHRRAPRGRALGFALTAGLLDMTANVLFLAAARQGLLSLVAIVSSMAPAWTIGLARLVLHERIGRVQLAGLALAAGALVLIGLG